MNQTSLDILECYIKGKDYDEYKILESIYDENAEVLFEISSRQISFPDKIQGNIEIAEVLSKNFNKHYKNVKTYYLSQPSRNQRDIENQKWLVVMRDINNGKTRVGTGYYNWQFRNTSSGLKIKSHKIYIHCMLELLDSEMTELSRIQNNLSYPWTSTNDVSEVIIPNKSLHDVSTYLNK